MLRTFKELVASNLRNVHGWRTNRKIVVIESDDWGAIRMPSKKVYDKLLSLGIGVDKSYYNQNDSLESNDDLDALFSVLRKYKDKNDNHPVFTALSIVANPNFEKIRSNNFNVYEYESVSETLKKYGAQHYNVLNLWQEGISEGIFKPEFHGREHINVKRWMNLLKNPNSIVKQCFSFNFIGLGAENGIPYLPAFDIDMISDLIDQKIILESGIKLFKQIYDYPPKFFVAPNNLLNSKLESFLMEQGITTLSSARKQLESFGNGKFKNNYRYTGKQNKHKQIYLCRNSQFEHGQDKNQGWEQTMKDIETAFFWNKAAIISTHRVNYIGNINEKNRKKGIKQLDNLLNNILKKWPDVEFMTSTQLVQLIKISK